MTRARKILNDVQEDEGATQAAPGGTVAALGTIPKVVLNGRKKRKRRISEDDVYESTKRLNNE